VLHRKLPLDTRPISRPIHKKICPLSALSVNSNYIIRHARLLRYGDATVAPVFPNEHSNHIFESVRQLRCGVPQQLQHHQARTSAPRAHASAPVWGAAAAPHHQARTQLPRAHASAPVWGASATPSSPSAHTAPRAHTSTPVWGAAAAPSSPRRVHSSAPSRVHGSCGVGCRSNSIITERAHSSSP